jgi:hypothetical protein
LAKPWRPLNTQNVVILLFILQMEQATILFLSTFHIDVDRHLGCPNQRFLKGNTPLPRVKIPKGAPMFSVVSRHHHLWHLTTPLKWYLDSKIKSLRDSSCSQFHPSWLLASINKRHFQCTKFYIQHLDHLGLFTIYATSSKFHSNVLFCAQTTLNHTKWTS